MKFFSKRLAGLLTLLVVVSAIGIGILTLPTVREFFASVFFTQSVTVSGLESKYRSGKKIRVLIVPGHEPTFGGAEYGNLKERNMAVDLAMDLAGALRNDPHYEVLVARDKTAWNPDLQNYFNTHWNDILAFEHSQKTEMGQLEASGQVVKLTNVIHNSAEPDVATRLFGINKWANDNNVDIMIHVHFNDYPRSHTSRPGVYNGFAMYIPDYQYSNSQATAAMASNVFQELSKNFPVSNLPTESSGIIQDQDLIAVGQSNTVNNVSMLIEYGYIYQPEFANSTTQAATFQTMATQTAKGVQDFFNSH